MKKTAVDAPVKADEHKKNGQKTDKTVDAQKDKKVPVKEEKKQEAVLLQQNAAKPEKSRSKDIDLG